jgi:hypothetical protein
MIKISSISFQKNLKLAERPLLVGARERERESEKMMRSKVALYEDEEQKMCL